MSEIKIPMSIEDLEMPPIDTAYVIRGMHEVWPGSVNGMPFPKNNGYFYGMDFTNTSLALFKAGQYNAVKEIEVYL